MLPIERKEPTLPIDRIEYADPIERMDPSDRMDSIDRVDLCDRIDWSGPDFFSGRPCVMSTRRCPIYRVYHGDRRCKRDPPKFGGSLSQDFDQATANMPTVGRKLQVMRSAPSGWVVSEPLITERTRPGPVSAIADRVAGPSGLMRAALVKFWVALRWLSMLTQVTVIGTGWSSTAGAVPRAVKTNPA